MQEGVRARGVGGGYDGRGGGGAAYEDRGGSAYEDRGGGESGYEHSEEEDGAQPLPEVSFFTLVTGPSGSLSLKLRDTRVYGPQIRARLGTTAHFCEVVAA